MPAVRTTYCRTYVLHCQLMYARMLKKAVLLQARQVPTSPTFCMHLLMYILHVRTVLLMYTRTLKKKCLLHIPGTCVPTDVRTHLLHLLHYWRTYVTTGRTALNKVYAHPCCTKLLYLLYVPSAVRTADGCIHILLYVLPVPTASSKYLRYW